MPITCLNRRWLFTSLAMAVAGVPASHVAPAAAATIDIVVSEAAGVYFETASLVRNELASRAALRIIPAEAIATKSEAALTVALGTRALQAALTQDRVPVVFGLVPRTAAEAAIRAGSARTVGGVFLDQPYTRQLALVRAVLDDKRRVGVLASLENERSIALLQTAAREMRMVVQHELIEGRDEIYPALARLLPEVDALLAVPDSLVYSAATIQNVLLTTYRARRPVFGFSPAYVRAGALAAVHSTPRDMAPQIAEIALRTLTTSASSMQYPRRFSVNVNGQVARSLGLTVGDEASIAAKIERLEREP